VQRWLIFSLCGKIDSNLLEANHDTQKVNHAQNPRSSSPQMGLRVVQSVDCPQRIFIGPHVDHLLSACSLAERLKKMHLPVASQFQAQPRLDLR
jgi:hypothetical protein